MLHKIKSKRLIALVVAFCLMGTAFLTGIPMRVTEASNASSGTPKATHTFSDFGVGKGTYKTDSKGNRFDGNIAELLDGGMLREIIKVNKLGSGNYFMVLFSDTTSSWAGLQIQITAAGKLQMGVSSHLYDTSKEFYLHINPSEAGLTSFIGTEFELGLAFEKADTDNNGSNDLLIKIYINGKQCSQTDAAWTAYQNGVYTIPGGYDKIVSGQNGANQFFNIYPQGGEVVFQEAFSATHNFEAFGVVDDTYTTNSTANKFGGDITELLDGGMLSEKITINSRGTGNYFMVLFSDTASSWAGLQMQVTAAGKLQMGVSSHLYDTSKEFYLHIEPSEVGLTSFIGTEFELGLAFEKADADNNGSNDLLIRIYINGKRCVKTDAAWTAYQNGIYTIPGGYDKIVNGQDGANQFFNIYPQGGSAKFEAVEVPSKLPTISIEASDAKDYKLISLNDMGIVDGTGKTVSGYYGESLHETILGMQVTFNTSGGRLHFGYNGEVSNYSGVAVRLQSNGTLRVENEIGANGLQFTGFDIEPAKTHLGAATFKGNTFILHLSTEIGKFGEAADKDDIKLGVFINGYLYNDQYLYIYDQADVFTDNLNFNEKTDTVWASVPTEQKPLPTNFKNITLSDAGIGNGNGNVYGEFLTLKNMDKTLFSTTIKFSKNLSRLHYGMCNDAESKFVGVGIRLDGDNLVVANEVGDTEGALTNLASRIIEPQVAGVGETFVAQEFLLQISTEFVDRNGEGGNNDVKLGIFINGTLYLNSYFYILDQAELFGTKININEGGADFASYEKQYKVLTLADFGVKNDSYDGVGYYKYDENSFDGTIVNAVVRFSKQGMSSFSLGSEGVGISFEPMKDGSIKLNYVDASKTSREIAVLTKKIAGVALVDNDIRLRVAFDMANVGDAVTDLRLGVYINGILYNYQYFTIADVETETLKRGISLKADSGKLGLASPVYAETTARDFSIPNTTFTNQEIYGYYDGKTMDQTAFTATLKFSKEKAGSNAVYIGGKKWTGLRVDLGSDGRLSFAHLHMDGHQSLVTFIEPQEVGMDTFFDTSFELRVTFDLVKENAKFINSNLGIYINGQMYKDNYIVVKHVEEQTLSRNLFIYTPKDGSVTITSVNNEVDFTIWGLNEAWKKTLGIK